MINLEYDITGSGPLLVALHGITEDRTFWDAVPLSDHFRTIRVDLRGHGQSPVEPPFDPLTLAADVHATVTTAVGGSAGAEAVDERPLVVGHSYGGVVATAYAHRFPVRGVVNLDQRLDVAPLPEQVAQAVRGGGFDGFMASFFTPFYAQLDPAVASDLQSRRRPRQDVVNGAWTPLMDLDAEALTAWMRELTTLPAHTPYLSLHGLPVDEQYARWLRTQISDAVIEQAPVVSHYLHLADSEWFMKRLIAFDAGLSAETPGRS